MKKLTAAIICMMLIPFSACSSGAQGTDPDMPESRTIPYAEGMETTEDAYGADALDLSLDHDDSRYYVINDYYTMESENGLHILTGFETYQQTTEYSCGAASALMVLNHYDYHQLNQLEICSLAETDTSKGTSVEGLVKFFNGIGWKTDYHAGTDFYFASIEDAEKYLIDRIDAGTPVMVDWEDWRGHWQVIIGIDTCGSVDPYDDVLIMADPYDVTDHCQDGYYIVPFGRFMDMWREGPCAQKSEPYEQPFVVAVPVK